MAACRQERGWGTVIKELSVVSSRLGLHGYGNDPLVKAGSAVTQDGVALINAQRARQVMT